jgi:hypothetical protein
MFDRTRFRRGVLDGMAGVLVLASLPAAAHHSVAAAFDTTRTIVIEGQVRELTLGSPHSRLVVETETADGQTMTWVTELASAAFLRRAGWTPKSLGVGERIRLTGSPSRYSATEVYAVTVTKANGTQLSLLPLWSGNAAH